MSRVVEKIISGVDASALITGLTIGPRSSLVTSLTTGVACNLTHGADLKAIAEAKNVASGYFGKPARVAVSDMIEMKNMVCRATAIAALNSLLHTEQSKEIHGFDILSRMAGGRRIAMVGHFNFTDRLRAICRHLDVLELEPNEGDLPASYASDVIPKADIVVITGTTCMNDTIDGLLELVHDEQFVMMLGPTTPMSKIFFEHRVDIVCGVQIENVGDMAERIDKGISFRDIDTWKHAVIAADENILYGPDHF